MKRYDVIVVGAGAAGSKAALLAAERKSTVALISESLIGGVWLHDGCIAVKSLVASQKMYRHLQAGADYGVRVEGVDSTLAEWLSRQRAVVSKMTTDLERRLAKAGVEVIRGRAHLTSEYRLSVRQDGAQIDLEAGKIILATGAHPTRLACYDHPPDGRVIGTSEHFVKMTAAPKNMLIVGGGYIGCEMAEIFHTLGTKITMVEAGPHLLPEMEADAGKFLQAKLEAEGMIIRLNSSVEGLEVTPTGDEANVRLSSREVLRADKVLIAVGRQANLEYMGLSGIGVTMDGGIEVNDYCQTNIPHIYAIGDCTGRVALAHSAMAQAAIAVGHAHGSSRRMDWDNVPFCVYTVPEIASTGYTEEQARQKGMEPMTARCPLRQVGRPIATGDMEGFVRLIADRKTRRIAGGMIVAAQASEMIATLVMAIKMQATVEDLATTVFPHPSLSEAIVEAAKELM